MDFIINRDKLSPPVNKHEVYNELYEIRTTNISNTDLNFV